MRALVIARAVVLALAAGLGGCASNMTSSVSVGGPPVVAPVAHSGFVIVDGGLVAGATIGISAAAANAFAATGIVAMLIVANDWRLLPPPKMREDRAVNLQDCSKPILNWTANLRCASPEELRAMAEPRQD
jgi:hypothetical protein